MYFDTRTFARFTAAFRYASDDTWGLVRQLEGQYDLSRDTIYRDCERIRHVLQPDRPGPKPDPTRRLGARVEELESENRSLKAQITQLEARVSRRVEVTPQRIEDLVLTAVTTPPSYVGIGAYVQVAFGEKYRPSPGKISQVVTQFGTLAGRILTESRVTDRFDEACADELFVGRRPILTVVEPRSLAIGAVEASDHRDAEDWQVVLERFRYLRYVTSDLGMGLGAGISRCAQILRHHPDFWHLVVRPLSRITRSLEAHLERVWDQERKALACQQRPKGQGKVYAPTIARIRGEVEAQFDRMEHYYQGLERLLEAFDPIVNEPSAPHLRTPQEAYTLLNEALELLLWVDDPKLNAFIQKLEAHREILFSFLVQLHQQIDAVPLEGIDDPEQAHRIRALVLSEILLSRQRAQSDAPKVVHAYARIWKEIIQQGPLLEYYATWRKALAACLYRPRRTSSLVETIHSPLRTLTQIHRNLSQPLLDLYALRHNMKPFARGCKRQGKSPYQRLGVDLGTEDWLEALRTYRTAS